MAQSPDKFRSSNHELGMRLLRQNTQSFADGLIRSGLLSPGVVIDIREQQEMYSHSAGFTFNKIERMLVADSGERQVPPTGAEILGTLMQRMNSIVTNRELVENIWGYTNVDKPGELTKGFVSNIRQDFAHLGIDSSSFLKTVHGVGYRMIDRENLTETVVVDRVHKEPVEIVEYRHPYFSYSPDDYRLVIDEEVVPVTKLEGDMLDAFCRLTNKVVSLERLIELLPEDTLASGLRVHIHHLRRKLANNREIDEPIILNKQGVGYMLVDFTKMSEKERDSILRNLGGIGKNSLRY